MLGDGSHMHQLSHSSHPPPSPTQEEKLSCPHPPTPSFFSKRKPPEKNPSIIYTRCLPPRLLKSQGGSQTQTGLKQLGLQSRQETGILEQQKVQRGQGRRPDPHTNP